MNFSPVGASLARWYFGNMGELVGSLERFGSQLNAICIWETAQTAMHFNINN